MARWLRSRQSIGRGQTQIEARVGTILPIVWVDDVNSNAEGTVTRSVPPAELLED